MGKKDKRRRSGPSRIADHHRDGRKLIPPMMNMPAPVVLTSWRDARMPELLWAVLLLGGLGRDRALELFRSVVSKVEQRGSGVVAVEVQHSRRTKTPHADFEDVFGQVLADPDAREALRPLLVFESLPDRNLWEPHLAAPDGTAAIALAKAVAPHDDHQSQDATDCRWLRVRAMQAGDRLVLPPELVAEFEGYPNVGEQTKVRPFVRATEGSLGDLDGTDVNAWPKDFWRECWEQTDCLAARRRDSGSAEHAETVKQLGSVYGEVGKHFFSTTADTGLDPRRDAVFGLVLYALNLAALMHQGGADQRVEGRLAVRTLTECYLTLAYLMAVDQSAVWAKFRSYGAGQAKLAYLKLYDLEQGDLPAYVTREELERLANEDMWQEFAEVDLGSWSGMDLRKMSEAAGVKAIYDKYYGWPSAFVHGHWGAVRDTVFDLCLNPLHRFHRIPTTPRYEMESVTPDVAKLVNLMLDLLNTAYPTFKPRVSKPAGAK